MKTVFDTRQCAHIWAQRSQPYGRTATDNVHFDGAVFYSYATPIANFAPVRNGSKEGAIALITSHSYSMTTSSRHMPAVRRALSSDQRSFTVPDVGASGGRAPSAITGPASDPKSWRAVHRENRDAMVAEYRALVASMLRQRNGIEHSYSTYQVERIEATAKNIQEYCEIFKVTFPAMIDWSADADEVARRNQRLRAAADSPDAVAKRERAAAARARKDERDEALRVADAATRRAAWIDGTLHSLPYGETTFEGGALLRVNRRYEGSEVQTSMGARVPLDQARKLLTFVERIRAGGRDFDASQPPITSDGKVISVNIGAAGSVLTIGDFRVRTIYANGDIQVGCHFIKWEEIARIAPALRG